MIEDKEHSTEYLYIIEAIATHTETGDKYVVYRALYKNEKKVYISTPLQDHTICLCLK